MSRAYGEVIEVNTIKKTISEKIFDVFNTVLLVLVAAATLYPIWHEICLSFSSLEEAMRGGIFLWPRNFTAAAYNSVLGSDYIWLAYGNTIFVTIVGTALSVLLTAMTAYPLAKKDLPGKNAIVSFVLFTMLFSGGMIPTYLLVKELGLINSLWALIIPGVVSAYNTFIMRNFFSTIPAELEESAFMDGANPIRIFFSIILPLSTPVLATIALWVAVGKWNDFFNALIYLNERSKYTLSLLLREIINGQEIARMTGEITESSTESVVGATIVVAVVPILCVYPFLQKYFVKGVLIGSIKG